ncbi:hemolysin III family protein [Acidithiobacillus sp. M4-SHS-6]|uniref:PAQR family membrane homeostasis protein TrhA n=1 Tax=Acidithiobacillus sp. M4-SHS-6 TaxID=3383024 RepID=UPI0039BE6C98
MSDQSIERDQTRLEEWINGLLHGAGAIGALLIFILWLVGAALHSKALAIVSISVFVITIVLLYGASTIYHLMPQGHAKLFFQWVDRSAIYLLIAGTYTPVTLMVLHDVWGMVLLVAEWVLALAGILLLVLTGKRFYSLSLALYLVMGWLAVLAVFPLYRASPGWFLWLLLGGGAAYTVGVVFFLLDRRKYFHSIWHVCVIAGTALQFWAILQFAG